MRKRQLLLQKTKELTGQRDRYIGSLFRGDEPVHVILKICLNEFLYQGREVSSCRFPESKQEASWIQCDTPIFLHVCRKVYEVGIWEAARLDIQELRWLPSV